MSRSLEIQGIIVPMITPLTDDDEVDVASLRRLVGFLVNEGVNGLWVLGAVGQFFTLSERQRDIVVETAIEAADGRVLGDIALMMGAAGCVPTLGNLVPATYAALYRSAIAGDWRAVRAYQDDAVRVERLIDAWGPGSVFGVFLGAVKTALYLMGIISSSNPGRPYPGPTAEQVSGIKSAMARLGLEETSAIGPRPAKSVRASD